MVVDSSGIADLCVEAEQGTLFYTTHVAEQSIKRDQPRRDDITTILCYDTAKVIEPYPNGPRGKCCLIWGTVAGGRIGHIVCSYPPNSLVITTYWPDLDPEKWEDLEYTIRRT